MTAAELRRLEARYQRAHRRAEEARQARNDAVRKALANGATVPELSRLLGLTRERVRQIREQKES